MVMVVLVISMTLSDIVNNAAAVLIMAPIAIEIAGGLSASPDAFLMSVAIGASCSFLTPIGHQSIHWLWDLEGINLVIIGRWVCLLR
jgi:di/tricarboxylate transporter